MGYERYDRGDQGSRDHNHDRDDGGYSSGSRDYAAAGGQRGTAGRGGYDRGGDRGGFDGRASGYYGRDDWNDRGGSQHQGGHGGQGYRPSASYGGGYARDDQRFTDVEDYGRERSRGQGYGQGYSQGRQGQGNDPRDRGFFDRAGDEVRSWFGDEDAERRREADARADRDRDADYRGWRSGQIAALDRDYDEYRRENRSKFESEFSTWRTDRQGQRTSLTSVTEHMEVVGSDGSPVGTVDKIRGDRIVLTKNDQDADGRHHSIPSRWIDKVDDKVTLRKTADEAHREWRDEERNQAVFGDDRNRSHDQDRGGDRGSGLLHRSFPGTY